MVFREIGHHIQGIVCKGLASMQMPHDMTEQVRYTLKRYTKSDKGGFHKQATASMTYSIQNSLWPTVQ